MSDYYKTYITKKTQPEAKPTEEVVNTPAVEPTPNISPVPKKQVGSFSLRKFFNLWVLLGLFIIVVTGVIAYFMLNPNNPLLAQVLGSKTKDEAEITVEEVGKLIILPSEEKPTVANITNVEQLKIRQPFFASAHNGDKLIVFKNKVIIYRPEEKKIVDVSQVSINTEETKSQDLPSSELLNP